MQGTGAWRGLRARSSFPPSRPLPAVQRHRRRRTREAAPRVSTGGRAEDRSRGSREDRWGGGHCHTRGLTPTPGPHLGLRTDSPAHARQGCVPVTARTGASVPCLCGRAGPHTRGTGRCVRGAHTREGTGMLWWEMHPRAHPEALSRAQEESGPGRPEPRPPTPIPNPGECQPSPYLPQASASLAATQHLRIPPPRCSRQARPPRDQSPRPVAQLPPGSERANVGSKVTGS